MQKVYVGDENMNKEFFAPPADGGRRAALLGAVRRRRAAGLAEHLAARGRRQELRPSEVPWPSSSSGAERSARALTVQMSYEILLEEREPIDGWTVCTVCLNVDRTATVARRSWRCADCGVDTSNNSQRSCATI